MPVVWVRGIRALLANADTYMGASLERTAPAGWYIAQEWVALITAWYAKCDTAYAKQSGVSVRHIYAGSYSAIRYDIANIEAAPIFVRPVDRARVLGADAAFGYLRMQRIFTGAATPKQSYRLFRTSQERLDLWGAEVELLRLEDV